MTLLLIRHGETALNARRVLQPADTPLSERGHGQAAALARRLASAGLVGILCSDLPRAEQTAAPLVAATGLRLVRTPLLQERNFGDLRGLPYDTLDIDPLRMEDAPPGGESQARFHERVAEAFAQALRLQAALGGPLAVITHGLVVKAMLMRHADPATAPDLPGGLRNTSISWVGSAPPHRVERVDCTAHLDDGPGAPAHARGSLSGG